jgi:hypothetical protein
MDDGGCEQGAGVGKKPGEAVLADIAFWIIQLPGWLLFAYLLVAQCTAALSYSVGVRMGTQEAATCITDVGVGFFKGFAGADLIFYTPVLGLGLVGHLSGASWTDLVLGAALGVTVYWPIVCLWTLRAVRGAAGWDLPKETQYWVVLPVIAAWGAMSLIILLLGV